MTNTPSKPERCPVCQFQWDLIDPAEVAPRMHIAVNAFAAILRVGGSVTTTRPSPERWSTLEYGAHLRDVMLLVRDRVILTVIEHVPTPPPLYRDDRVRLGLYVNEEPLVVAGDLEMASRLFITTYETLRHDYLERTLIYGFPSGSERSLGWTAAQVLHECEHHLSDVRENSESLTN